MKCSASASPYSLLAYCGVSFNLGSCVLFLNCSAAEPVPSSDKKDSAKPVESKPQSTSGIEDLFKDSPAVTVSSAPAAPQVNVKNDIMSLFEKVSASITFTNAFVKWLCHLKERAHLWFI